MIESASWTDKHGSFEAHGFVSIQLNEVVLLPDGTLRRDSGFGQFARCVALTRAGERCSNEFALKASMGAVQIGGIWCTVFEVEGAYDYESCDFGLQLCRVHAAMQDVKTACPPELGELYEVPAEDVAAVRRWAAHSRHV